MRCGEPKKRSEIDVLYGSLRDKQIHSFSLQRSLRAQLEEKAAAIDTTLRKTTVEVEQALLTHYKRKSVSADIARLRRVPKHLLSTEELEALSTEVQDDIPFPLASLPETVFVPRSIIRFQRADKLLFANLFLPGAIVTLSSARTAVLIGCAGQQFADCRAEASVRPEVLYETETLEKLEKESLM